MNRRKHHPILLVAAILLILLSTTTIAPASATLLPTATNFNSCNHHFVNTVTPSRRSPNCSTAAECPDLCHAHTAAGGGYYASRQNSALRVPEWTAFRLNAENAHLAAANSFSRPPWRQDPGIADEKQYPLSNPLWDSTGPFDKGHMVSYASLDHTKDAADSTMVMTNVCAQHDGCNRGEWKSLETASRTWVTTHNKTLYFFIAAGYKDFSNPNWTAADFVVPEYMAMLICDPVSKESVALVAESSKDNCGGILETYRTVKHVEKNYLGGVSFFDESKCRPCNLNNSHWFTFTGSRYSSGSSTPDLCSSSNSTNNNSTNRDGESMLTTAAIAGGTVVLVIIVALLAVALWKSKSKKNKDDDGNNDSSNEPTTQQQDDFENGGGEEWTLLPSGLYLHASGVYYDAESGQYFEQQLQQENAGHDDDDDDWVFDDESGLYWSGKQGVWYSAETGEYFSPSS